MTCGKYAGTGANMENYAYHAVLSCYSIQRSSCVSSGTRFLHFFLDCPSTAIGPTIGILGNLYHCFFC